MTTNRHETEAEMHAAVTRTMRKRQGGAAPCNPNEQAKALDILAAIEVFVRGGLRVPLVLIDELRDLQGAL